MISPMVYGGAIVLRTLAGVAVFQERIGPLQVSGLVLVALGIACIAYPAIAPEPSTSERTSTPDRCARLAVTALAALRRAAVIGVLGVQFGQL